MNSKYLTLAVTLVASLFLAACNGGNGNNSNNTNTAKNSSDQSAVIATVNDEDIHESALDAVLTNLSGGRQLNPSPQAKRQLLNRLVKLKVVAQEARSQGLADDPYVRIQKEGVLADALIKDYLDKNPVTDKDIQAAYQKQIAAMDQNEYKARHILVNDKETAENVIDKLDNGADFATLAEKISTGPSAKKGGELGWFSPSDMVKPFSDAVKKLDKGQYTKQPVKTQFGWHVILLQDTRPVSKPELADEKSSIKRRLQQQTAKSYITSLREQANVDIDESQFQPETPAPQSAAPAQDLEAPEPATATQPQATGSGD